MKKLVVASKNPVKMAAVKNGFEKMFPAETFLLDGVSVPSGVSEQPMSDIETLEGAWNRCHLACDAVPKADFWIGIEGDVKNRAGEIEAFLSEGCFSQDHYYATGLMY